MKRLIEGKIQKGLQQHAEQRVKGRWAYWQRQTGQNAEQLAVKQSILNINSSKKETSREPKAKALQHHIKAY